MPFNSNALSDKDIIYILKSQGIKFNGVYMKDELPSKLKTGFYVINLASEKENNGGTHWTALFYNSKQSYYFDAFGFIAPVEVEKKLNAYTYNDKQIQNLKSTACGYYCLSFILFMYGEKDMKLRFKLFVDAFSTNTKENDKLLYNYLYN